MDILMAIIYLKLQFCISFDTKQLIKTNLMKMFDRISRWPLYWVDFKQKFEKLPVFWWACWKYGSWLDAVWENVAKLTTSYLALAYVPTASSSAV